MLASDAFAYRLFAGPLFLGASLGLYGAVTHAPVISSDPVLVVAFATFQGSNVLTLLWMAALALVIGISMVAALSVTGADKIATHCPDDLLCGNCCLSPNRLFAFGQMAVGGKSVTQYAAAATSCFGLETIAIAGHRLLKRMALPLRAGSTDSVFKAGNPAP